MHRAYLVIVRKSGNTWFVDRDSYHLLEGRGTDVMELQVRALRPLASMGEGDCIYLEGGDQDADGQEAAATA